MCLPSVHVSSSLWILLALCLSPALHPAKAYLDPGTGSYIIQVAIGVVFGGAYAFRTFIGRTIQRFKKGKQRDQD